MGIPHSTARVIAPLSFAIDFVAQQYGMLSTLNMKDIHDANLSFFSPQPYFIAGFFFPQQIIQLVWLYRLWKLKPEQSKEQKYEAKVMVDFVPFYVVGNLCIATWMIFWNASSLKTSNIFVTINTLSQLLFITTMQPRLNTSSTSSILTHLVSKTFAGIGVLDLLHNTSAAYFRNFGAPSGLVQALTAVCFVGAATCSDWIFGGCLVYDLVALAVGQSGRGESGWAGMLGGIAVATAGVVGLKNWARKPYISEDVSGYEAIAPGEGVSGS